MSTPDTKQALRTALEPFSRPLTTADELKVVPMRMDAIVAILLASDKVRNKLGPGRTKDFSATSPELPVLLRELGDPDLLEAADHASDLLELCRPSIIESDDIADEIVIADGLREKFRETFADGIESVHL